MSAKSKFPGGLKQIANYVEGSVYLARARRDERQSESKLSTDFEYEYAPWGFRNQLIKALYAILPGEVQHSNILQSHNHRKVVDHLLEYQMALNDRLDFTAISGRINFFEKLVGHENEALQALHRSLDQIDDPPREQLKQAIMAR